MSETEWESLGDVKIKEGNIFEYISLNISDNTIENSKYSFILFRTSDLKKNKKFSPNPPIITKYDFEVDNFTAEEDKEIIQDYKFKTKVENIKSKVQNGKVMYATNSNHIKIIK